MMTGGPEHKLLKFLCFSLLLLLASILLKLCSSFLFLLSSSLSTGRDDDLDIPVYGAAGGVSGEGAGVGGIVSRHGEIDKILIMDHQSMPDEMSNPDQKSRSDEILRYIDEFLMEDDVEPHKLLQETSEFRAQERSLYELLGKDYPPSPQQESITPSLDQDDEYVNDNDKNVAIKEFDDDEWIYAADDDELATSIANMQLTGCNTETTQQQAMPKIIRSKKRGNRRIVEAVVDLRALLMDCAKSIFVGDRVTAESLLTQIRQYSSISGDGNQRMAHYFADGLEARLLVGTPACGGKTQHFDKSTSSSNYLRVYRIFRASSLFRKISSFACNETILDRSERATTVHVIDFGILYGFQWPSFIRRAAGRGGCQKLRITGVDFPMMEEIIEDTGRRLASYAEKLGVPFEFKAIAREWESIKVEDLKIQKGEFVAVVCSIRCMKLFEEQVESPRAMVLKLIREINPDIFIHGILNGSHNQPFFVYRFRDLVFHFMSVFDMLETLVPRDKPERMMIERDVIGKDILNMIACEGPERVERPETHRQWHARHVKAGFVSVPFQRDLMDAIVFKVKGFYHKDYLIFEEKQWLMMSWKGRVIFAMSCWQPI